MGERYPEIPDYIKKEIEAGGEIDDLFIDKEGRWFHNGAPFKNQRIVDFFNRSLAVTQDGIYVIHYGKYIYPIRVEDVPVFVTGVHFTGFGSFEKVVMNLSLGREEELDIDTLEYKKEHLYCRVADGMFPAKFLRSPAFHILERLDEFEGKYYITLCGKKIQLEQDKSE